MLNRYIQPEQIGQNLTKIADSIRSGVPTAVFGVTDSEKFHIAGTLNLPFLYIVRDELSAKLAAVELRAVSGKKIVCLPAKDDVLLFNKTFNKESLYARIGALFQLSKGVDGVVATFESLHQLMPEKIEHVTLVKGDEYPLDRIIKKFVTLGYKRVDEIEKKEEFVVRGDVLQIFPINCDAPVRLDFFGDELEEISYYDEVGGKLIGKLDKLNVLSVVDFTVDPAEVALIKEKLKKEVQAVGVNIFSNNAREIYNELSEKLDNDRTHKSISFVAPLLSCMNGSIGKFLGDDAVVIYDECKMLRDSQEGLFKEHSERCLSLKRNCEGFSFMIKQLKTPEQMASELDFSKKLALQNLTTAINYFNPLATFRLQCTPVPHYSLKPDDFFVDIKNWKTFGYRVLICCSSTERAQRIFDQLEEKRIFSDLGDNFPVDFQGVKVTTFYLGKGFIYHDDKFVVIGTNDIFSRKDREKKLRKKRGELYNAPEVGDYCVHEVHGIGIVRGTQKITTSDSAKEYVAIEYRGGDMLYVCVDRMDSLTKYLGGEEKPSLSKIGGQEFEKVKEHVKASIAKLTINLKKLYRDRQSQKGFAFSPDDGLMNEFEERFEFDETEDQLQSIAEIKSDMESTKVMDRLLCGDVGYGKTEVAFRAAFKAICDCKQVALVAPTTILAEQHYMTAKKRFQDFGVRIAALNRFRTQSEQTKTLYELEQGEIDLIIGTHRMFSKDVKFKDLGLLILDEEQRFGVEHKEKLKLLKENVDTLTMSATPIPRTLHMSLSGIRDISTINTPPTSRIPVQVFVTEESESLLTDAITKELARNGQVFVLYNRVEGIDAFAHRLSELVTDAKIIVGHGQMPEKQLEANVLAFYRHEYDVLVSTTIIENGVDLPDANTLIVIDADYLGLSTLYQLKGRVGRGDKMARAYFTFKADKVLSETAYKRLTALTEYSGLGSGFKIAMRDLEIRGAGNVLGKEQHGHMEKIGYELYAKLLKQELGEVTVNYETEIDVSVSAFIPENYVKTHSNRMDCYKQIAEIASEADERRIIDGLKSNYGALPEEVENLILIAKLKNLCRNFEIIKAEITRDKCGFTMKNLNSLNDEGIMNLIDEFKQSVTLTFLENPYVVIKRDGKDNKTILQEMIAMLEFAVKSKKK